jgi:hypothetical protein
MVIILFKQILKILSKGLRRMVVFKEFQEPEAILMLSPKVNIREYRM